MKNEIDIGSVVWKYSQTLRGGQGLIAADINNVLVPEAIAKFMRATGEFKDHARYYITGNFVTRLIRNSYAAGNNGFTLDTNGLPLMQDLGRGLKGRQDNPIKLDVDGCVGYACGSDVEYVHLSVSGVAESMLGQFARSSLFRIDGHPVLDFSGMARNCTFIIGRTEEPFRILHSRYCTYKTSDEATLRNLIDAVPGIYRPRSDGPTKIPSSNKVVLVKADGLEEVARDYCLDIL